MSYTLLDDFRNLNVPFTLTLGENVTFKNGYAYEMFNNCYEYNAPFNVPDDTKYASSMFKGCHNLNSPININPSSPITDMSYMFYECFNFQQNINIPSSCNYFYSIVGGSYYDQQNGTYIYPEYQGNFHIYSNERGYGEGNFAYAFQWGNTMNANVMFHDVQPTSMYAAFEWDYHFDRNVYLPDSVEDLMYTFAYCNRLNQNIHIPANANVCTYMFQSCDNLNQNISIPDGVIAYGMFMYCNNLNQPIRLPSDGVIDSIFHCCYNLNQPFEVPYYNTEYNLDYPYDANENRSLLNSCYGSGIFRYCNNLNQPITLNDNIESLVGTFSYCENFNQNVIMPSNLKFAHTVFQGCYQAFNQNIAFPEGTLEMVSTFYSCTNLNQNIHIPSTVKKLTGCFWATNTNYNIQIPSGCLDTAEMFSSCSLLNQDIYIPSSVQNVASMFYWCSNYNGNPVLPEGVVNCSSFAYHCNNLYLSEVTIPSSVRNMQNAFDATKVLNINIQTNNFSYSGSVINVALASNTDGKTPMSFARMTPTGYACYFPIDDWEEITWGTPIGEMKIPIDAITTSDLPVIYNFWDRQLCGAGHNNYSTWRADRNYGGTIYAYTYNNNPMTIFVPSTGVQYTVPEYQVVYADYPNATSESDVNYYWYKITFY